MFSPRRHIRHAHGRSQNGERGKCAKRIEMSVCRKKGRSTFSCVRAPTHAGSPVKQGGAVTPTARYGREEKERWKNGKVPRNNTGRREPRTHQHPRNSTVSQRTSHDGRHQHVQDLQRPLQTRRSRGTSAQGGRGWARGNLTRLPRPVSS